MFVKWKKISILSSLSFNQPSWYNNNQQSNNDGENHEMKMKIQINKNDGGDNNQ